MSRRHANMHEDLVTSLKSIMTAIAKHTKVYLPPEISTPTEFIMITDSVLTMV